MGRGDRKTKKGKVFAGSYGVSRPKSDNKPSTEVKKTAKKAAK